MIFWRAWRAIRNFRNSLSATALNRLQRIRQLVVDQLCAATGGPCFYIGRSMKTSHAGMGITEADWQITASHLVATLDKFKVPEREKGEVMALVATLKPDIVSAPAPKP